VAVLDTDLQSPGIHILFNFDQQKVKLTLYDFLRGKCAIGQVAYDVSERCDPRSSGKIWLVPAALNAQAITQLLEEGYDIQRLNANFDELLDEFDLDYLFIDTLSIGSSSPGYTGRPTEFVESGIGTRLSAGAFSGSHGKFRVRMATRSRSSNPRICSHGQFLSAGGRTSGVARLAARSGLERGKGAPMAAAQRDSQGMDQTPSSGRLSPFCRGGQIVGVTCSSAAR
jgi:hypothetical protein